MEAVQALTKINWITFCITLFAIAFAIKEIIEIVGYFKKKLRIKTGFDEDKETLEERIATLEKHDKWQYNEISKISQGIDDIRKQLLDSEIDSMRWEILDFSSSLAAGRKFSKEQFDHVISTHEKYIKILEENNMSNGLVTSSMEVIEEKYKDPSENFKSEVIFLSAKNFSNSTARI